MGKISRRTSYVCVVVGALALALGGVRVVNSQSAGRTDRMSPGVLLEDQVYLPIIVRHSEMSSCGSIQTAIDSLPPAGGQVIVSSGIFTCTSPIVIDRDNVDLRGQGHSTILRLADGANSPVLVIGQTVTPPLVVRKNIRVADLTMDGNRVGQSVECWGGLCDTGGLTAIRNNGITIRHASDVEIESVTILRARSGGLVTEKGSRRVTVQGLSCADNAFDGIAAYETENSIFSDLHLHDNEYAGLSLDIRFNNNVVSNAIITDNGGPGIFMRDSRDNLFTTIQIRGSGQQGLFLAQVDGNTTTPASGNTFDGLVVSDSALDGLRVNDLSCVNNLVVAAQFVDNDGACISEPTPGLVLQSGVVCR